jgi:predicted nucleic-acid-binding protein
MRAIDTNVLVRLIARDNEQQTAAAEEFVRGSVWASTLALAETVWVLSSIYGFGPEALGTAIEELINNDKLTLEDSEVVVSALALFRAYPALGFSDCLIFASARQAGHVPLGTFDRRLAKLDGAQLVGPKSKLK